jgi:intein/homing endonuclease
VQAVRDKDVGKGVQNGQELLQRILELLAPCFAAGTPLLTPEGSKPIEELRVGDLVLSRSEFDPSGRVEAKRVEAVFVRTGRILHVHTGGQVLRTTREHPFYVRGKGWVAGGELQVGDLLSSHDGRWVPVEDLLDTGEYETVYNLRVAEFHTYFVGSRDWGFSIWAHNECNLDVKDKLVEEVKKNPDLNDVQLSFQQVDRDLLDRNMKSVPSELKQLILKQDPDKSSLIYLVYDRGAGELLKVGQASAVNLDSTWARYMQGNWPASETAARQEADPQAIWAQRKVDIYYSKVDSKDVGKLESFIRNTIDDGRFGNIPMPWDFKRREGKQPPIQWR